jgi:hypothetical protein
VDFLLRPSTLNRRQFGGLVAVKIKIEKAERRVNVHRFQNIIGDNQKKSTGKIGGKIGRENRKNRVGSWGKQGELQGKLRREISRGIKRTHLPD